jgi:hypothetical protein
MSGGILGGLGFPICKVFIELDRSEIGHLTSEEASSVAPPKMCSRL